MHLEGVKSFFAKYCGTSFFAHMGYAVAVSVKIIIYNVVNLEKNFFANLANSGNLQKNLLFWGEIL